MYSILPCLTIMTFCVRNPHYLGSSIDDFTEFFIAAHHPVPTNTWESAINYREDTKCRHREKQLRNKSSGNLIVYLRKEYYDWDFVTTDRVQDEHRTVCKHRPTVYQTSMYHACCRRPEKGWSCRVHTKEYHADCVQCERTRIHQHLLHLQHHLCKRKGLSNDFGRYLKRILVAWVVGIIWNDRPTGYCSRRDDMTT